MTELPVSHRFDSALKDFYDSHNIEISSLLNTSTSNNKSPFLHRFVRLNPRYESEETLRILRKELGGIPPIHVPWLPNDAFYAIPADFALSSSSGFQSGRFYGMDVSSGAAVSALLSDTHNRATASSSCPKESNDKEKTIRALDLCCCPGLKLCAIADSVPPGSTVIGVDISKQRMALCSKIVQKYHIDTSTRASNDSSSNPSVKIQLYCQDGTTFGTRGVDFNLMFDSRIAMEEESNKGTRKRKNKSARARERKRLKLMVDLEISAGRSENDDGVNKINEEDIGSIQDEELRQHTQLALPVASVQPFDYVLVDAECSTDGSLKHLRERLKGTATFTQQNQLLTDNEKLAGLVDLQKRLLSSGYRLLKPGGCLVYSTCSLSQDQNENIVQWLLDQCSDAYVIPVTFSLAENSELVVEGSLEGTVKFYPNLSQKSDALFGDGFFLAKLGKQAKVT